MKKMIRSAKAALGAALGRFFYTRPAFKRALLAVALWAPSILVQLMVGSNEIGLAWALLLAAFFWGMGAERAALDWDPVFSLPLLRSFAFWRWQPLERKRFLALAATLLTGGLVSLAWGVLA